MDAIRAVGAELDDLTINDPDGSTREVVVDVRARDPDELAEVAATLGELPEVTRCVVQRKRAYGGPVVQEKRDLEG